MLGDPISARLFIRPGAIELGPGCGPEEGCRRGLGAAANAGRGVGGRFWRRPPGLGRGFRRKKSKHRLRSELRGRVPPSPAPAGACGGGRLTHVQAGRGGGQQAPSYWRSGSDSAPCADSPAACSPQVALFCTSEELVPQCFLNPPVLPRPPWGHARVDVGPRQVGEEGPPHSRCRAKSCPLSACLY